MCWESTCCYSSVKVSFGPVGKEDVWIEITSRIFQVGMVWIFVHELLQGDVYAPLISISGVDVIPEVQHLSLVCAAAILVATLLHEIIKAANAFQLVDANLSNLFVCVGAVDLPCGFFDSLWAGTTGLPQGASLVFGPKLFGRTCARQTVPGSMWVLHTMEPLLVREVALFFLIPGFATNGGAVVLDVLALEGSSALAQVIGVHDSECETLVPELTGGSHLYPPLLQARLGGA
mmetsp:Transcript_7794/g.13490  ORF Transcript_7794/g.13490 Transcript_7794/m.13490 type:complete len:233 (-) Transcript_7794:463-1161(-)